MQDYQYTSKRIIAILEYPMNLLKISLHTYMEYFEIQLLKNGKIKLTKLNYANSNTI